MRFIVDECTGPKVAEWLRAQGHEVFSVYEVSRGINDEQILDNAFDEDRILITNDKDFGEMIFRDHRKHRGVIFLRLSDERATKKIEVLERLLANYADKIGEHFVTVTETKVRFS
jgi:predicted nuclease of predicted toxin-antitoxin system